MKTKYKSCLSATEELQYITAGDNPANSFKENGPVEKAANYAVSTIAAVSSSKYVIIQTDRLSGEGVSKEKKIYNTFKKQQKKKDSVSTFGTIKNYSKNRVFKKNNIIYDLLN